MNRKGQALILFVLLLPLFIMFLAIIVDLGLVTNARIKYESIAKDCLKVIKNSSEEEGQRLLEKNGLNKDEYTITKDSNSIEITINTKVDAIFGTIINMKEYEIDIKEKGEAWWVKEMVKVLASSP